MIVLTRLIAPLVGRLGASGAASLVVGTVRVVARLTGASCGRGRGALGAVGVWLPTWLLVWLLRLALRLVCELGLGGSWLRTYWGRL